MLTTVAAGRVFDYNYCIGMYGMSGQGFWTPQDFALADDGLMYVLNRGAEELGQRVSRVTQDHQFLGQFGSIRSRRWSVRLAPLDHPGRMTATSTPPTTF